MLVILGGTFNPIHETHVQLALRVAKELPDASIRLMPNALPPHRATPKVSAVDRLTMCQLAVSDHPRILVDDYECRKSSPSYTVETLIHLRQSVGKDRSIAWLLGADAFNKRNTWHRHEELSSLCHFIVVSRPGSDRGNEHLSPLTALHNTAAGLNALLPFELSTTSSTDIRALLQRGETPSAEVLAPKVLAYIKAHGLYV